MLILALDTATLVSSVAVTSGEKLLAELTLQTKLTHSEVLMPHIKQILEMTKVEKNKIEAIAVSIGPGSFTGLRIGLATVKSIAYVLNIPIIGVSTLAALAYNYPVEGVYLAPMLDAQKGNVYAALYTWEQGELKEIYEPTVKPFDQVIEFCQTLDKIVVLQGEVAVKQAEKIKSIGGNVRLAMPHMIMPRAASVAMLGKHMMEKGIVHNVMDLEPFYIRRSEAEELWERRNGIKND